LGDDEIANLLVRYTDGTSVRSLADEYRIHRTTVMDHLERSGVPRRRCVRSLTDEQVAEASLYYAQGESLAVVASRYVVSARTIAREFEQAGIPTRLRNGWVTPT
jgi:predicted DNA-binding protein YlxM (UPF0122 family)